MFVVELTKEEFESISQETDAKVHRRVDVENDDCSGEQFETSWFVDEAGTMIMTCREDARW
jgi:hypothetical protein